MLKPSKLLKYFVCSLKVLDVFEKVNKKQESCISILFKQSTTLTHLYLNQAVSLNGINHEDRYLAGLYFKT